jgi:phage shock protein C
MVPLHRSRTNRVLAGIFGGIGETYRFDPNILRITFAFLTLMTGVMPMVVLYLLAWFLIPEESPVTLV